jgi:hypothetical protein
MEAHADRGAGPRETAHGRVCVVMAVVMVLVAALPSASNVSLLVIALGQNHSIK